VLLTDVQAHRPLFSSSLRSIAVLLSIIRWILGIGFIERHPRLLEIGPNFGLFLPKPQRHSWQAMSQGLV
jgi:hypothetical protein